MSPPARRHSRGRIEGALMTRLFVPAEWGAQACVGVLGHFGHGKTTLTRALVARRWDRETIRTVCDWSPPTVCDWSPGRPWIEASRSDALSVSLYDSPRRCYAHFDCRRHRDTVQALVTGNARMDAAILVVAADEGPMRETREQVPLASWLGIEHLVVFLSKVD